MSARGASNPLRTPTTAYLGALAVLAGTYSLSGWLSLKVSLVGGVVTPIWPPTGIAVVALLIGGYRLWPAITVGALIVNVPVNDSLRAAALIAVGNTLAPLVAARLLGSVDFRRDLDRLRDAVALVVLGALVAMTVSATLGSAALTLTDEVRGSAFGSTWAVWWAGDATGVLVFAPLLLSLRRRPQWRRVEVAEGVVVLGVLTAVSFVVFRDRGQDTYLVFPFLIWMSVRFRQLGGALGAVASVSMAVWAATDEKGPFADASFLHRMLTLQVYDAVLALTSFVLVAIIAQRATALSDLREALDREHGITETLQRSLLPEHLPDVPGVAFAARYLPGAAGLDVGGDWYDVIVLPRGRLGLVVGDVVGRGLGAAATMGQLRTGVRAYALESLSPATVLERMSRLVGELESARMATLVYAVLDPEGGTLTYASAGHPPPLMLEAGGRARFLDDGRSLPLGLVAGLRQEAATAFTPGSTLLLYTDGLVESRRRSIEDGLDALRVSVTAYDGDLDTLCDERVLAATRPENGEDDVAVLAVRLLPVPSGELRLDFPAEPSSLSAIRRAVRTTVVQWGATREEADDLVLAVGEASSNVIEHAYGPAGGPLHLRIAPLGDTVEVAVRDEGRWRTGRDDGGGRGLDLIHHLVDEVVIERTATGTEVRFRRRLGGPGPAAPPMSVPRSRRGADTPYDVAVVRLAGDIDLANAGTLYDELVGAVPHDSAGLVVDLTEVDHIDSAGLRLLYRVAERLALRRLRMAVIAADGSPVRRLLRLSGFERTASITASLEGAVAELSAAATRTPDDLRTN